MIGDLTQTEMEDVLRRQTYGHLACCIDEAPSIVPIFYAYASHVIYGHTYEGQKVNALRENDAVCFQVDDVRDVFLWQSVLVRGTWEELQGKEVLHAVDRLSHRLGVALSAQDSSYLRHDGGSHAFRRDGRRVVLYGIRIQTMTGRFERS